MAAETSAARAVTRRVKMLALEKAEYILKDPTHPLYNETYLTVLKNSVPRTQEIVGEDGDAVAIKIINYANASGEVPTEAVPNSIPESV